MSGRRFEGRSLEEALTQAASGLGVERWQLTYHVIVEKRGFLGGLKRIVIEAEINPAASEPPREEQHRAPAAVASKPEPRPKSQVRERQPRPEPPDTGSADETGEEIADQEREDRPEDSVEVARVRAWCEQVFQRAGLRLRITAEENDEEIRILLSGRDQARLTAKAGELLDSLQVLVNKALTGRAIEKRVELDASGFKAERERELTGQAREIAELVRKEGRERILPAMTPIERRIVHLALQDEGDVMTESRGEGFLKRVAIVPRSGDSPDRAES